MNGGVMNGGVMNPQSAVLVANVALAWFLAGLIWTIQVVHYPLFARVGREGFAAYEQAHAHLITMVVGPAMLAELLAAVALVALRPRGVPAWAAWALLALLAAIWASTAFIQVPCHNVLSRGFDADAHARLVSTNWIRTIAWSARALLLAWCGWKALEAAASGANP
jgi:hypothetical protein